MKVLVCPLDWGLGHATRCIPLIRALTACGHQVSVGATGGGQRLLKAEFPSMDIFEYPGYQVRYSRSPATFLPVLLMQMPALLLGMFRERAFLKRILTDKHPDLVISDGRYGVFTRIVPTLFVTHQIFIRIPGRFPGSDLAVKWVLALNVKLLRRFKEVWVPDYPGSKNLSGALSHGISGLSNVVFIHPLSRFKVGEERTLKSTADAQNAKPLGDIPVDILALVSGPEPQRGLFETSLRQAFKKQSGTRVLVCGIPQAAGQNQPLNFSLQSGELNEFPHLPGDTLRQLLSQAKMVVARSGYTTVMEMASLEVKAAVLVPTPGQSEQEYLADHLERSRTAMRMDQDHLDLTQAAQNLSTYSGFTTGTHTNATSSQMSLDVDGFTLFDFIQRHPLFQSKTSY